VEVWCSFCLENHLMVWSMQRPSRHIVLYACIAGV
jgi:hypothetical protein